MPHTRRLFHLSGTDSLPPLTVTTETRAPSLHPLEKALLVIVATHLVFLPWALGAMHIWSQGVSFGLSLVSLCVALKSRDDPSNGTAESSFRPDPLPTLLRFPIFWLGLAFLLYTVVQALNPAWQWIHTDHGGWLRGVSFVTWLPAGMRTPIAVASPWRALMIHGSAWLSACAVWTGFTRRTALRILLAALVVNAFLLALLGLAQRALHADRIFWFWKPPASYFVASFIYRNHAGAYFDLALAITCALTLWYYRRQIRHHEPSSPAVLLGFFAAVIVAIVLYSYSRTAMLLMIVFLAVVAVIFGRAALASRAPGHARLTTVFAGAVFVAVVALSLVSLRTGQMTERMRGLAQEAEAGLENTRLVVAKATWAMVRDQPVFGWGAGSFSFGFPGYQIRYPEICVARDSRKRMFFEHAHDDYLELLAEYGVVGCAFLLGGFCFYSYQLFHLRVWRNPPAAILLFGCLLTMVHAAFDFPLFNPAILITWCCLWTLILRWLTIDRWRSPSGSVIPPSS